MSVGCFLWRDCEFLFGFLLGLLCRLLSLHALLFVSWRHHSIAAGFGACTDLTSGVHVQCCVERWVHPVGVGHRGGELTKELPG